MSLGTRLNGGHTMIRTVAAFLKRARIAAALCGFLSVAATSVVTVTAPAVVAVMVSSAPAAAYPGDCTGYSASLDCLSCCARNYKSHPNCTNACKANSSFDSKAQMSPKPAKQNMSPRRQQ